MGPPSGSATGDLRKGPPRCYRGKLPEGANARLYNPLAQVAVAEGEVPILKILLAIFCDITILYPDITLYPRENTPSQFEVPNGVQVAL